MRFDSLHFVLVAVVAVLVLVAVAGRREGIDELGKNQRWYFRDNRSARLGYAERDHGSLPSPVSEY